MYITRPNFVAVDQTVAEIWPFFDQDGGRTIVQAVITEILNVSKMTYFVSGGT